MRYLGDFPVDGIVYFSFSTQKADGTPITLADAAVVVRKNDTAAPLTLDPAPVLAVDLNGVTGLHNAKVDLADSDFVAGDYDVCLSAGTVDGVSVAGRVLAHFSIENRTAPPTVEQIQSGLALTGEAASALDTYDPPTKDELDSAIAGIPAAPTPPTAAAIRQEMDTNSVKLANLDMAISAIDVTADTTGLATAEDVETAQTAIIAAIPGAPTNFAITDTATDEAGNPLPGAEVRVFNNVGCTGQVLDTATTNDLGGFTVYVNEAGTYYLRISFNNRYTTIVQKEAS